MKIFVGAALENLSKDGVYFHIRQRHLHALRFIVVIVFMLGFFQRDSLPYAAAASLHAKFVDLGGFRALSLLAHPDPVSLTASGGESRRMLTADAAEIQTYAAAVLANLAESGAWSRSFSRLVEPVV